MKTALAAIALCMVLAPEAHPKTLYLKNGRAVEAKEIRLEGDAYVVTMPTGRERRVPRRLVDEARTIAAPEPAKPASSASAARHETKPAPADHGKDDPSEKGGAKVFTNSDLPHEGQGDGTSAPPTTFGEKFDEAKTGVGRTVEDKKWDAWRRRTIAAQARLDSAQKVVDDLDAKADQVNGDIETAGDGTRIQGARPGHGYFAEREIAKHKRDEAQAALDQLRAEAEAAGVPPGVMR